MIDISPIEVLALKKLTLVCHALSKSVTGYMAQQEMRTLTQVLNDITLRADLANQLPQANRESV